MDVNAASWAEVTERLEALLADLADGGAVLVDGGEGRARPYRVRGSRLRRALLGGRYRDVPPWVRLTRVEDHVRGTCVRMQDGDDGFPMSQQEAGAIVALGWHEPGPMDGGDFVRFWPDDIPNGPYLPPADRSVVARGALAVLREVFDVPPEEVRITPEPT